MKIQFKSSEVLILLAASVMSFLANLPEQTLGTMVDRKALLAGLTALVVVALFRYLQTMLLLTISILAIGANLPAELASELGISQLAMLVSLGALIAVALLNRVTRLLPTHKEGIADDDRDDVTDSRQTMLNAISKGDQATVLRLLVMNESVNFSLNGTTPLHMAAEKGYPEIVRILISHGADFRIKNADGKTALDIAMDKKKFIQTQEILHKASRPDFAALNQTETRRADADIWHNQHGS